MRASLVSSGRAVAHVCAACRREAVAARATRSITPTVTVTAPARRTLQTAASAPISKQLRPAPTPSRTYSTNPASTSQADSASQHPSSSRSTIPPYYALFPETLPDGPPPSGKFHIDLRALRREFLRLQAASHPDFHHSAASSSPSTSQDPSRPTNDSNTTTSKSTARLRAEATSSLINAAYKTLSSPLLRAQYLLRTQHGIDLEGDEAGSSASAPPELLMAVLEAREAIEEAGSEADLEEVRAENEGRIRESERVLGEALEKGEVGRAVEEAVRLRYWVNIREGVEGWEEGRPVVLQH